MKNINKVFSLMAGVALFALASCDDGNPAAIYDLQEEEQGYCFLTETAGNVYNCTYTDKVYTIKVARNFAGEEVTLPIANDYTGSLLTIPSSVTFAAGETLADLTIGIEGMTPGNYYDFTLAIDSANLSKLGSEYGIAETAVELGVEYTWSKIGVVEASDDWSGSTAKVELQQALEYEGSHNEILVRLVSLEFMLEPDYADEGYHFQFFLDKDTYEPLGTASVVQLMGETNGADGNLYYFYNPASGHTFEKEANVYTLSGYIGYDSYTTTVSAGWYWNLEFTWVEDYPLNDLPEDEPDEPEEEVGNGFGAIVAGGTADDYVGTYTASYLDDGKKKSTADVTLTKVDDETILMTGLMKGGYDLVDKGITLKLFGGLLYFESQLVGGNKYSDEVAAYAYDSNTGYFYDDMMLVAGFKENGEIQFTNYSYNGDEDTVDGIIYIFALNGDYYAGSDNIPCSIVLSQPAAKAVSKDFPTVVESLKASRDIFGLRTAKIMGTLR